MTKFEVGEKYEPNDAGLSPIKIIKRTDKTCLVENKDGSRWRMRIRQTDDGEMMIDSSVPGKWRGAFTYLSKYKAKGEE